MEKIENLKRKAKELEYNKKQLETQIQKITEEIELLKSQRYYLNAFEYISNIPSYFDEPTVSRMKKIGNYFETVEEAEKEIKKRDLMVEIEEFRKERNGNWKPDWEDSNEPKYYLSRFRNQLSVTGTIINDYLPKFGYFKNYEDCNQAIWMFGARILELYAD